MKTTRPEIQNPRRQGRLLAFSMSGAMAMALTACHDSGPTMIVPPVDFNTNQAEWVYGTNAPPTASTVHSSGGGVFLGSRGYYPVYGYPGYYYRPAPGSTVELVSGASSSYRAGSPAEARANVARGGFGSSGGHGGGEGE